ncbi:MAG: pyruvate dehydrogenase (acetyl-transferring) E1 component subunit alpha [Anaerolineae bacterium]|nr:pyruvate dehydrogenase (acetyl-transferring) E1 component subunit alpha [Thermoflexales bacterium]MDW8054500.1 pyruvate dehydrogenase (acetyl-transferring) E1 component subunit alpha [Anaerolineae bacterium]
MDRESLISLYRQMLLIRVFEDRAAEMYAKAKIAGFLHLYNGQEAIAVGAVSALNPDDEIVVNYRDHGWALARGCSARAVMAELFGRATGTTGGRGGSMHLVDVSRHFWGGYAIVGGHLPLAVGLGVAAQYLGTGRVTLCSMGDGSTNIGTFHAAMNWAKLWNVPVIFVVENNQYAMGTAYEVHSAVPMLTKAAGYNMYAEEVDGMDVMAVREAVCRAAERARSGLGPSFLNMVTYRFRGHSMADPDVQRSKEEIAEWRKRDPITRFADEVLLKRELVTQADLDAIRKSVEEEVEDAIQFADQSPEPPLESLYDYIYMQPVSNMQIGGSLIRPPKLGGRVAPNGKHHVPAQTSYA